MKMDAIVWKIQGLISRDINERWQNVSVDGFDFHRACFNLGHRRVRPGDVVAILTGFFIPSADAHETDGPLGAVFLSRVLARLGWDVWLISDSAALGFLQAAVRELGMESHIKVASVTEALELIRRKRVGRITHLIAIERAGPSHTLESLHKQKRVGPVPEAEFLAQVPAEHWDHYHTMRGDIITDCMEPGHRLVEELKAKQGDSLTTIGIGDGGNEIGMGKIPWEVIARNVTNGGLVACRVPVDHNLVCGVSNWGAYGLAAGAWHLAGRPFHAELFSPQREQDLWSKVLTECLLVDGMTGKRTLTVDGLSWEQYIAPLEEIRRLFGV